MKYFTPEELKEKVIGRVNKQCREDFSEDNYMCLNQSQATSMIESLIDLIAAMDYAAQYYLPPEVKE